MSEKIKDGGPGFPCERHEGFPHMNYCGMSLRDYFASAALMGIVAHPQGNAGKWEQAAQDAFRAADAMLKERGRKNEIK